MLIWVINKETVEPIITELTKPPMAPSIVFPGLIFLANLCFPKIFPKAKAEESLTEEIKITYRKISLLLLIINKI